MDGPVQKTPTVVHIKDRFYRRRFLIPNAVTLGSMFCGFLAIIYASSGRFEKAVVAVGLSILLDGLDGRVARTFNATSRFGVEFDSFSDLVSFGVAPAILVYNWCFRVPADEWGVFVCFVFALCAAARLARFNISDPSLKAFTGLPTPGAAGMAVTVVNIAPEMAPGYLQTCFCTVLMLGLAFLMVSKLEFLSIKQLKLSRMHPLVLPALGISIALVWYYPRVGLLAVASIYSLSGPVRWLMQKKQGAAKALHEMPKREGI